MHRIVEQYPNCFEFDRETGCLNWLRYKTKKGHGEVHLGGRGGKNERVHRLSWQLENGTIPQGLFVLHRCNNAACANVAHLYLGTHDDNMRDMKVSGRRKFKTHGERSGRAVLTEGQVIELRARVKRGDRYSDMAKEYGVTKGALRHAAVGINWSYLNEQYPV
jgi:hypothetical protein